MTTSARVAMSPAAHFAAGTVTDLALPLADDRSASDSTLRLDVFGRYGVDEALVVTVVLIGIGDGEGGDGTVEGVATAEVRADRYRVSGAGMRSGQHPAAHLAVDLEHRGFHRGDVGRGLPVPQLPHVVVVGSAVDAVEAFPPEEDVAGRLHEPLTLDDALTVIVVLAGAEERFEHRGLS